MTRKRLYHIDLLRFLAAFYVLLYHYCFRGYSKDNLTTVQFAELEDYTKYGYLGVDLFFIISGFVILMSVINSNIIAFIISRFSRLYPAYWVCLILTSFVLFYWATPELKPTISQVLFNLTMFHGFFDIPHIDGVYWSLIIELKFYIIIGIILFFKAIKHIKIFGILLLVIAILHLFFPFKDVLFPIKLIYFMTFPKLSSYFVAGMFFFIIHKEGFKWKYFLTIVLCYLISLIYAFERADYLNEAYIHKFSYVTVSLFISSFYLLFYLISLERLNFLNKRYFMTLGAITYPLYLIHQNIGYTIMNNLTSYLNKWVLLILLILFMLMLSYFIQKLIEKPMGAYFRLKLKENKFILYLQSKNKY